MKKIGNLFLAASVLGASCSNFLEKPLSKDVYKEDIFASRGLAQRAIDVMYVGLPFGIPQKKNKPLVCIGQATLDNMTDLTNNLQNRGNGMHDYYYPGVYNSSIEQKNPGQVKYSFTDEGQWDAIRQAWLVIENIDQVPDMTPEEKGCAKAQARIIIAIHYIEMLRHLGGVPKVNHAYSADESFENPRMTVKEQLDWIIRLLDDAIDEEGLPDKYPDPNDYGRLTRVAALALKARAYHFVASPLFNSPAPYLEGEASSKGYTWLGGYDKELWKKARDAAKEAIDAAESAGYGLVQPATNNMKGYRAAFRKAYFEPSNGETLIITRSEIAKYPNGPEGNMMFFETITQGASCPTQNLADMYPLFSTGKDIKEGMPNYDPDSPVRYDDQFPNENRDPRYYETIITNNDTFGKGTPGVARLWDGGKEILDGKRMAGMGTISRKFYLGGFKGSMESAGKPVVWPYMRLAELYLIYAEAANQYEEGPSTQAYRYVNDVRGRVGLSPLSGMDKETFHKAVMKERACEFVLESVRWFDIIRWKMEEVFKAKIRGVQSYLWGKNTSYDTSGKTLATRENKFQGDYLIGDGVLGTDGVIYEKLTKDKANTNFNKNNHVITYEYYEVEDKDDRAWKTSFSPKWYLSAFPMGEVNKDYGLIQNPGW